MVKDCRSRKTEPAKNHRRRKTDPKVIERRKQREIEAKIDKAIEREWLTAQWATYSEYAIWKNENLPDAWPKLDRHYVTKAISRVKRKRRYLAK